MGSGYRRVSDGNKQKNIGPAAEANLTLATHPKPWRSLHLKFLALNLGGIIVFAAILFAIWEYVAFRSENSKLEKKLDEVAAIQSSILAVPVWNLETDRVELILESILRDEDFIAATVTDELGQTLATRGTATGDRLHTTTSSIDFSGGDGVKVLGELTLVATQARTYAAATKRLLTDLFVVCLLMTASVLASLLAFHRYINSPLRHLLDAINQIKTHQTRKEIQWDSNDEIGIVISEFNDMQKRQERFEQDLKDARDSLERRVRERTATLEKTNQNLQSEIAIRIKAEAEVKRLALEDSLTGLPNRTHFLSRLNDALAQSNRTGRQVGVMLLDLDKFKNVNDTLGHPAGDQLLKAVSERLVECARETDTVARLGGDEFAIVVTNIRSSHDAMVLARRIVDRLSEPIPIEDRKVVTGASVGITIFPDDPGTSAQLLRNADLALYRAKDNGRGTFHLFDEALNAEVQARQSLEEDLREAFEKDDLYIEYQPQIDLANGKVIGAEALMRWRHENRGMVSPGEFIPIAEATRMIIPMSRWLVKTVCRQIKQWQSQGWTNPRVSVNVSPLHFKQRSLPEEIDQCLREFSLPPQVLELEITEGMVMFGGQDMVEMLNRVKDLGVGLSIDDFGTGYSSLNYLKRFPVDRLKIDQSFVRDIESDWADATICSAIIRLGHSLNLKVIAEGVESKEVLKFLCKHDCDEVQGFFLSRPLSAQDFTAYMKQYDAGTTFELFQSCRPAAIPAPMQSQMPDLNTTHRPWPPSSRR